MWITFVREENKMKSGNQEKGKRNREWNWNIGEMEWWRNARQNGHWWSFMVICRCLIEGMVEERFQDYKIE